jgi:hypothetical protein
LNAPVLLLLLLLLLLLPSNREKLEGAARQVLPIDQLPNEEQTVAAAHVAGQDLPKAGESLYCRGDQGAG